MAGIGAATSEFLAFSTGNFAGLHDPHTDC